MEAYKHFTSPCQFQMNAKLIHTEKLIKRVNVPTDVYKKIKEQINLWINKKLRS